MVHPVTAHGAAAVGGLTLTAVFTIAAAQLSFAVQIGEQGDYLRLMPDPEGAAGRRRWRLAVLMGGPGLSLFAIVIFFASTLLVGYAGTETTPDHVAVPVDLFTVVYERAVGDHTVALVLAGVLVLLSQIKINIMNTYSGSLSWSNFFSRLLHRHPGRAVWVVLQVALALVLMEIDIFAHIVTVLAWYANIGIAWIAAMASDLVINKRWLKLSPSEVEFRRAHLYNVNPVGFGSMVAAAAVSIVAYYGAFGSTAADLSPFIAFVLALALPPLVAVLTRGRWYIARTSVFPDGATELPCAVCGGSYDVADMATCPFHQGHICSLCCSTEGSCRDACKPSAWRPPKGPVLLGMPGPAPAPSVPASLEQAPEALR